MCKYCLAFPGVACVASVSVRFRSKERPRIGIFGFDRARNKTPFVARSLTPVPGSLLLNRTETLATEAIPGVPIPLTNKLIKLERRTSPQRTLILPGFSFTPSYRRSSARFTLHYGIRRSHPRFLTWAVSPAVLATLLCDKAAINSDLKNSPIFPLPQLFRDTVC